MNPVKTPIAARLVGTTYGNLIAILRAGQVPEPARDTSGHYLWSADDIARARRAMADRQKRRGPKAAPAP